MLSCLVQADSEIHSFKIPTHTFSSIFKAILHKLDLPATCKQLKWLWRNLTSDKFHASGVLLVDQFADPRKRRPCGDVFGRARCAATVKHISNCLEELRAKSNLRGGNVSITWSPREAQPLGCGSCSLFFPPCSLGWLHSPSGNVYSYLCFASN